MRYTVPDTHGSSSLFAVLRPAGAVLAFVLVGLAWAVSSAHAELVWDRRQIVIEATPDQTESVVEYPFRNAGDKPVSVLEVKSDCGCTVARLDKLQYAPGEEGKIPVTFTFGERNGEQTRTIKVKTDDGRPETLLTLVVQIPKIISISPKTLRWDVGETPEKKTAVITGLEGHPLQIIGVTSDDKRFVPSFKTLEDGQKYQLEVVPTDLGVSATVPIRIQVQLPSGGVREFHMYALSKEEEPPAQAGQ